MSKHRLERPSRVRPRLGRIAAAVGSLLVTTVALLGGVGIIPIGDSGSAAAYRDSLPTTPSTALLEAPVTTSSRPPEAAPDRSGTELPAATGTGKRVVFSMSRQRVWLVGSKGVPQVTYLVSGSLTNNLKPGRYDVYSRSRWAVGIDDSGVMQYFVRFTRGENAPIGFHSIPTKNGRALQKESQLGTPQSHGCIRARLADAKRLYQFAPPGTDVVVVA